MIIKIQLLQLQELGMIENETKVLTGAELNILSDDDLAEAAKRSFCLCKEYHLCKQTKNYCRCHKENKLYRSYDGATE